MFVSVTPSVKAGSWNNQLPELFIQSFILSLKFGNATG